MEDLPAMYLSKRLATIARDVSERSSSALDGKCNHPFPLLFDHAISLPAVPDHFALHNSEWLHSRMFQDNGDGQHEKGYGDEYIQRND